MCEYLPPLIVHLWIYTLNTFWPGIPHWTRRACCCETGIAPEVSWNRPCCQSESPVAPLTATSHTLLERRAWALARSLEAKPPCGRFPHHSRGDFCVGVEACGEVDVLARTRGSGRWRWGWWLEHLRRKEAETYGRGCPVRTKWSPQNSYNSTAAKSKVLRRNLPANPL
jgi:hypothetical protein